LFGLNQKRKWQAFLCSIDYGLKSAINSISSYRRSVFKLLHHQKLLETATEKSKNNFKK